VGVTCGVGAAYPSKAPEFAPANAVYISQLIRYAENCQNQ